MPFKPYSDVILLEDVPEHHLCAGDVGTVVEHHVAGEEGYSVEFFDMTGKTIAVVTLPAASLRAPSATDLPSVRTMKRRTG